eukprot:superscaffoldBa00000086_g1285
MYDALTVIKSSKGQTDEALLSSFDHVRLLALFLTLFSTLMGLTAEKTRSGLQWKRRKYPIHPVRFFPAGPFQYLTYPPQDPQSGDRRMPGSDRCRTKGAVVYRYVPSLLPSLHPPILCLPLRETGPLLLQVRQCCVADLNVTAEEKEGKWVVCCLFPPAHLKCHSASPGQSPCAMQITYQHKAKRETCVEDKESLSWTVQTPVTSPDPSLSSWLHISAPHPAPPPASAFRLMQLLSQHPAHFPLLLLQFNLPASTLDLAPGLSPPAPVPLLPPAWMDLSSGKHTDSTTPHTLFRDMGPILTTAKLTWHGSDWSDPRKAKRTHERAGAFVFVECHTSSRGKPITGPGRPLKLWEGCVGIASVATSDVNSNILIAGYFLD